MVRGVQTQADWDRIAARLAADAVRKERDSWWNTLNRAIATNEIHAFAYLGDFVAGVAGLPVDPVWIADWLALCHRAPGARLRPALEDLTVELVDNSPQLAEASPWWPEVFWGWPGLPRLARGRRTPGGVQLRERMVDALPELAQRSGWHRHLFEREGAPWASLATVAAILRPHPPY
jgi:hypothetical protein